MGNAEFKNVRKLLGDSGTKYQVPPYQRGYEWGTDEWKDLWLDGHRIKQSETHFLGNIILLDK
jgi:uncharacterized protein with ParB-like and HNH nuclease domain